MIVDPDSAILNINNGQGGIAATEQQNRLAPPNQGLTPQHEDISNRSPATSKSTHGRKSPKDAGKVSSNLATDHYQSMLAMGTSTGIIKIFSLKGYE